MWGKKQTASDGSRRKSWCRCFLAPEMGDNNSIQKQFFNQIRNKYFPPPLRLSLQWFNCQKSKGITSSRGMKANVELIIYASFYVLSIFSLRSDSGEVFARLLVALSTPRDLFDRQSRKNLINLGGGALKVQWCQFMGSTGEPNLFVNIAW